GLVDDSGMVLEESEAFMPIAFDESLAYEHIAGHLPVEAAVADPPVGDERDPVERDLLVDHRCAGLRRPVRIRMLTGDEVPSGFDDPVGVDRGDRAGPQTGGLDEFGGHDEV